MSIITEQAQASIERVGHYDPINVQGQGSHAYRVVVETSQGNTYPIILAADSEDQASAFALEAVELVELGQVVKVTRLMPWLNTPIAADPSDNLPEKDAREGERERGSLEVDPEVSAERKARQAEAVNFLKGYTGRFAFLLEMQDRVFGEVSLGNRPISAVGSKVNRRLSERQVDAVLRCKANGERRAADQADRLMDEYEARTGSVEVAQAARQMGVAPDEKDRIIGRRIAETGIDLTGLPTGMERNGTDHLYAAAPGEDGTLSFVRIDRPQRGKWAGFVFVRLVVGGGADQRLGTQGPGRLYQGGAQHVLRAVLEDPMAAIARFGQEIGKCGICGLTLTDEESRRIGIGPVCRSK